MAYYLYSYQCGTDAIISNGDGYSMTLSWFRAYPSVATNNIGYNIYFSTDRDTCISEGPKYFIDDDITSQNLFGFSPKELYYMCVRPVEYNSLSGTDLPITNGLKTYVHSELREDITETDLTIPLVDTFGFPDVGTIRIGAENIDYYANDSFNNNLILNAISDRGVNGTIPHIHNVDGYDGYTTYSTKVPFIIFGEESKFDNIYICQCTFEYDHYPFIEGDGYKQHIKDILTTDLAGAEEIAEALLPYDGTGYHRTDPVELLNGYCVGSYMGGERGCYGDKTRGLNLEQASNERLEQLLLIDGVNCVLMKRQWTGKRCVCFTPQRESPIERCNFCYGTGFVVGYEQYYNPKFSSGQIKVRFSPADESVKLSENGFESTYDTDAWTLTAPIIKNHDILIKLDRFGNEEFRYEILSVNRNTLINSQQGAQKMRLTRIRKTDPLYQVMAFRDTSTMPQKVNLSIESGRLIPPHTHEIVVNENGLSQQTTAVSNGHNHIIYLDPDDGWIVREVLGHTHTII